MLSRVYGRVNSLMLRSGPASAVPWLNTFDRSSSALNQRSLSTTPWMHNRQSAGSPFDSDSDDDALVHSQDGTTRSNESQIDPIDQWKTDATELITPADLPQARSPFALTNKPIIPDVPALDFSKRIKGIFPGDDLIPQSELDMTAHLKQLKKEKLMEKRSHKVSKYPLPIEKKRLAAADLMRQEGTAFGKGKRKTARAEAWIKPGSGEVYVNGMLHTEYFTSWEWRWNFVEPFEETGTLGEYDVYANVKGGGNMGQAEAIRLAISRALASLSPKKYEPILKKVLLLRQDIRTVERKKPGRRKARRGFQWVRR